MINILISLNGECTVTKNQLLKKYDYIFGVDGGTKYLYNLSYLPTHIIGDFDSIKTSTKNTAAKDGATILTYDKNKNETDLEIALEVAKQHGSESITIIGGEGKELDHLFSNLLTISAFNKTEHIEWITKNETIIFSPNNNFYTEVDKIFSIITLSQLTNLTIKGSKWDIDNMDIPYGSSRTLRNIALQKDIEVYCDDGKYCIVLKN
jgi:thiamine pyrophosphokinase|tara:strand:+ start:14696 stop:15316 length:621 start_codon:yes stop_codon:yes gene_type:complete